MWASKTPTAHLTKFNCPLLQTLLVPLSSTRGQQVPAAESREPQTLLILHEENDWTCLLLLVCVKALNWIKVLLENQPGWGGGAESDRDPNQCVLVCTGLTINSHWSVTGHFVKCSFMLKPYVGALTSLVITYMPIKTRVLRVNLTRVDPQLRARLSRSSRERMDSSLVPDVVFRINWRWSRLVIQNEVINSLFRSNVARSTFAGWKEGAVVDEGSHKHMVDLFHSATPLSFQDIIAAITS